MVNSQEDLMRCSTCKDADTYTKLLLMEVSFLINELSYRIFFNDTTKNYKEREGIVSSI
jgi:hypothetical protein